MTPAPPVRPGCYRRTRSWSALTAVAAASTSWREANLWSMADGELLPAPWVEVEATRGQARRRRCWR